MWKIVWSKNQKPARYNAFSLFQCTTYSAVAHKCCILRVKWNTFYSMKCGEWKRVCVVYFPKYCYNNEYHLIYCVTKLNYCLQIEANVVYSWFWLVHSLHANLLEHVINLTGTNLTKVQLTNSPRKAGLSFYKSTHLNIENDLILNLYFDTFNYLSPSSKQIQCNIRKQKVLRKFQKIQLL